MTRILLTLLCFATTLASAALTPLPGSTPQRARALEAFPNPVRLQVTDGAGLPVSGASVSWFFPPSHFGDIGTYDESPCRPRGIDDLVITCSAVSSADGIVEIRGLYGERAGTFTFRFDAKSADGRTSLGSAELLFQVDARAALQQLVHISGNGQRAVVGTRFPQPMIVRVLSPEGAPVKGASVGFSPAPFDDDTLGFRFPNSAYQYVDTDEQGFATSPPIAAGWIPGQHKLHASIRDFEARANVSVNIDATVTTATGGFDIALTNMWWAGPLETGWGASVVQHGDQLFNVLFVYDADGKPTWFVQPGGTWSNGTGSRFHGFLYSPRSSPWFDYDASRFDVKRSVGAMDLTFKGPERGRLDLTLLEPQPFVNITKDILRQDFTGDAPSPLQGVADMWWGGPAQNGWGVAILEQFGGLFAVWFTYDADGKPTWFVMPGGEWRDSTTYAGTMYRTSGSPWVGRPYDASKLKVGAVGPYTLKFHDTDRATLEVNVDGVSRSLPITRQPF